MNDILAQIIQAAEHLPLEDEADDIARDKALGELEALIYKARQMISDKWRANRDTKPSITHIDLEDLGL